MIQEVYVHSSIEYKITCIYPSIEHEGKICVCVLYPDNTQDIMYLSHLNQQSNESNYTC